MAPCATFCNIPLSASVDPVSERSLISLDWLLTAGIPAPQSVTSGVLTLPSGNTVCSMNVKLSVTAGLLYDLVLTMIGFFLSPNSASCFIPSFLGDRTFRTTAIWSIYIPLFYFHLI
ncbi:hypothetical protein B0H14DRAFT_2768053, partial [Mycena olivaceomarginata]